MHVNENPERAGEVPQRSKPMETFEIFQKVDFSSQRSVNRNEEKLTVIHKKTVKTVNSRVHYPSLKGSTNCKKSISEERRRKL